ncbi:MAG: phenylacetate--CoA ligase PaaK [Rhodospirillaceae bacterium]
MAASVYEPIEACSIADLRKLQLERLGWSLRHAYAGNPRYRRLFDAAGTRPDSLASLENFARFPFTTKANLREAYPFGFFAVPMERVSRLHASSGTTGKPTVVAYTKNDIALWAQLIARSIHAAGGRPGMKVHVAYGYGLFTGGLGAHYGAEALGCTVIPMSGGQTEKQVQLIGDFKPEIIMATPSYMLAILDEFRRQGVDPKASSLRIGLMGAEPWTEKMRAEIETGFSMQALDIYGLSEVIGPGVAQEYADTRDGPTIWEDHFYPEIVNPETGEVLPEGEEGELVLTSLTKEAMPVIRYRTRDLARLLPGNGRAMRRITRIVGRSDDMLLIRGVNVFPSQVEEQVLKCPDLAPLYLIEVSRPARLDEICVRVELRPGSSGDPARIAHDLQARIKDTIGVKALIDVAMPGTLERSQGKAKRVLDLRPKS